ncbi:MAG: diacylglycerol/lipid kinase family protein [Thermodesulfobacteriota bacterium]
MKILIIANPIASGGDAGKRAERLSAILEQRGHRTELHLTRFAGDGRQRVARTTGDVDRIVIVGGDGTFNEVLNGIPEGCSIPVAQLPTGNANLLAHDLALPKEPLDTANLLENGRILMADTARMNRHKFIMIASAGFDARVTEELKKVRTGRASNFSYILPAFRALRNKERTSFTAVVDDRVFVKGQWVVVCKTRSYGAICEMAFDAGVDTGLLDIIVLPWENAGALLLYFLLAKFSRITRLSQVSYLKGKKVAITADAPIPMEVDGDFAGRFPEVIIEILPGCLPLMVPQHYNY